MASKENIQYGCFILLVSLILSTSRVRFSGAADTLLQHQLMKDGETLISANQTFELGFFSAGNSSKRYVGIWFHKVPKNSSVWIANRENPLADRSGTLTFDGNGSLVITDGRGGSFVVASSSRSGSMAAMLLDSGNLVVRDVDDSSRVFWESFDHPTDTYLPGMKLKVVGGKNRGLVTSWTSSHDPSPGDFSLGLDPSNPLEFLMWKKGSIYWTTGPWNGMVFANLETNKALNYDCYFITYVAIDNERYFTYSLRNGSIILKLMLDYTGHLKQLQWDDSTQDWISIWSQPSVSCDVYDYCGSFGSCSVTRVPPCQCLQGFQPGSLADWSKGNFSRGCVRRTSLQCGNGAQNDRFLMIPSIKFPAKAQISSAGTEEDCESACLNNCSCTAYAFAGGCTLWHGDLVNLRELREEDTTGNSGTLYLRLAASELRDSKGKKKVIVAIAVPITLFVLTLLLCFVWLRSHKGKRKTLKEKSFKLNGGVQSKIKENESGSEFFFDFSQIVDATENFSNANKLGQGGFGPVYKGQLPEGQEIAVKRLSARSGQGLEEFENEIALIAQLQHRNLVRLLGYCIQGEEKILIYEYMPNKSLDHFLFDPTRAAQVDWGRRFHIIEGIAQGLLYLHKHSRLRIIHRDLKASNILLDGDMNPRISDFGMARIFGSDDAEGNTKRVVGTYGYMPPEYALEGLFSVKSDVFSFGVLLLEIVSGKRNAGFHQYGKSLNLLGYAWDLWKADKWLDLVDPSLSDTSSSCELSKSIQVALLCVQESAADRPTMTDVITMFSSSSITLPDPKQPAFFSVRIATEEEPSSSGPEIYSLNDVTFSIIDGR